MSREQVVSIMSVDKMKAQSLSTQKHPETPGRFGHAHAEKKKNQIGHHARPRRASATAPLRTGADICKTGSAAGKNPPPEPSRRDPTSTWSPAGEHYATQKHKITARMMR